MTHSQGIHATRITGAEAAGGDLLLSRIHRGEVLHISPGVASLSLQSAVERVIERHFVTLEHLRRAYEEWVFRPWWTQRRPQTDEDSMRTPLPFLRSELGRVPARDASDTPSNSASARHYFANLRELRSALQVDPDVCAGVVALLGELGLVRASTRVDALRLRVHAGDAHLDPAALAAFTAHRDTWYANPVSQLNLWMPLHEVAAQETFRIFPSVLGEAVTNDSAGFDYDDFVTRVGFQGRAAGPIVYPCATDPNQLEHLAQQPAIAIEGRAGSVFAFSAAHLHQPCRHHGLLARVSLDLRVVDLDAERAGKGPPAIDRACRGNALRDYLSLDELSTRTRATFAAMAPAPAPTTPGTVAAMQGDPPGFDPDRGRVADLIARLEHWAALQPDRIALVGAWREGPTQAACERAWSWRELAEAVARLSSRMVHVVHGRRESDPHGDRCLVPRVVLLLRRGPAFVIALLACFRAGLAAVPVDPDQPEPRARTMLSIAAPDLLVHDGLDQARWSAVLSLPRIDLTASAEPDDRSAAAGREDLPAASIRADDLAYLIFTSGSTGDPKGVAVAHRDLGALWSFQSRMFDVDRAAHVLWMLSPSFDASISDIGCAIWAGARLDVLPAEWTVTPDSVCTAMLERATTHVDLPPRVVAALAGRRLPGSLRTVIVGGEASDPAILAGLARDVRVVAVYGPTEATVCTHLVEVDPLAWHEHAIGSPRTGVRERIVPASDPDGRAPRHAEHHARPVLGELWLGGPCLALGYLDPSQAGPQLIADTAWPIAAPDADAPDTRSGARFVWHEGERWYRTGDLVERRELGQLVYLGRRDRQLKIAGRLIAPEEIEQVIRRDLGVASHACARPRPRPAALGNAGVPPDLELALILEGDPADAEALATKARAALNAALPRWMFPARVQVVAALPRGQSDKVDPIATQRRLDEQEALGRRWGDDATHRNIGSDDALEQCTTPGLSTLATDRRGSDDSAAREPGLRPRDEIERVLLRAIEAVTGRRLEDREQDLLAAQGLSSIELIELVAHAELRGLPLTLEILEQGRHLAGIAALLGDPPSRDDSDRGACGSAPPGAMSRAQLDAHVDRELAILERLRLRESVNPSPLFDPTEFRPPEEKRSIDAAAGSPRGGPGRRIFLTGATGFLGTHLLAALLTPPERVEEDTRTGRTGPDGVTGPARVRTGTDRDDGSVASRGSRGRAPLASHLVPPLEPHLAPPLEPEIGGAAAEPTAVLCLLRGDSQAHARARLVEALTRFGHDPALAHDPRVEIVLGDLEAIADVFERAARCETGDLEPDESLRSIFDAAARADLLIHGAAKVQLTKSFVALAPTNLGGTRAVLELWRRTRASLLYISTLSVFVASDRPIGTFTEDDDLTSTRYVLGGYAQSKWAAERLVRRFAASLAESTTIDPRADTAQGSGTRSARPSGQLTIARLGLLTGHSRQGAAPQHDLLVLMTRGLARLGVYPAPVPAELAFDLSPVDVVAGALAFLAQVRRDLPGAQRVETLHLAAAHGCPFSALVEVVDEVLRSDPAPLAHFAAGLTAVDTATWEQALLCHDDDDAPLERSAAYLALSRVVAKPGLRRRHPALDLLQATQATFVATQATRALEGWSGAWPTEPREVLRVAVRSALRGGSETASSPKTPRGPRP